MSITDPLHFKAPQEVEVCQHPGGGITITVVDAEGNEHTIDGFPTIQAADPRQQWLLGSIAPQLMVKIEHSQHARERTPRTLNDITDTPDNMLIPVFVRKEQS